MYIRAVFADFKETLYHSTAFRAERCPENPTKYLVHHYNRSDAFDWARHNFQLVADEEKGVSNVSANSGHTQVRLLSQKI